MRRSYRVLETRVAPRDRDLAFGLLYQAGLVTVLTKRKRGGLILEAQLNPGSRNIVKNLRASERTTRRKIFRQARVRKVLRGDWAENYQKFLKPFDLVAGADTTARLIVDPRPSSRAKTGTLAVKASLAFGTGTHPTTQLTAILLERCIRQKKRPAVLDVGCGTAILAMAAGRWGAGKIIAVDNDPEALSIARENLRINALQKILLRESLPDRTRRFDVIVANIIAPVLIDLKSELLARLKKGGHLILSGLLYQDVPALRKRYRELKFLERKNRRGWAALLWEK